MDLLVNGNSHSGAPWGRDGSVAGQVVTETLVLAACGGLAGLLLAVLGCAAVQAFGPADIPRLGETRVDWYVVLFTAGVSVFTALAASLWPALQSGRTRVASREWTPVSARRTGDLLVVGQFALALVLMISATLLVRSFLRLRAVDAGFRPDHLLSMRIDLHVGKTDDQQAAYFEAAMRRAEAIPGVLSAGAITGFLRTDPEDSVQLEDIPCSIRGLARTGLRANSSKRPASLCGRGVFFWIGTDGANLL